MQEKQTSVSDRNLYSAQVETDFELREQLEFYRELAESASLELNHEPQQRQELEKELWYASQELYYMNQENQELIAAFDSELERSRLLSDRVARFAAQYDQLKARFKKLEARFNDVGTNFLEFKAHIMAWRLRNDTEAESGIAASARKNAPGTCGTVKEAYREI